MAIHLPRELIDGIIDQLRDDLSTLGACSLTCRAMLDRSRVHKLSQMTIRASPVLGGETIDVEISGYIRHITAIGDYARMWQEMVKCTNLRHLTLIDSSFTTFPAHILAGEPPFPVLKRLDLFSCKFLGSKCPNIGHLISSFPILDSLDIRDCEWPAAWRTQRMELISRYPPLSNELNALNCPNILDILMTFPGGVRFKYVTVEGGDIRDTINNIVTACGSNLRTLRLMVSWDNMRKFAIFALVDEPLIQRIITALSLDLSRNNKIKNLTLPHLFLFHRSQQVSPTRIAQRLSSSSLQFIEILLWGNFSTRRQVHQPDWQALDIALCDEARLPGLRRVLVRCRGAGSMQYVDMPMLFARRILDLVGEDT